MAYNTIESLHNKHNVWCSACGNTKLEIKNIPDKHRQYDNHIFLVYMHVNKVNGKVYVGITHNANPNKRWGYNGQRYTHSVKFANAINKYGWDNFEHIILCRTTKERAITIEKTLIAHYKKLGISYNIADGGEGTECISEKNRRIVSERMRTNHPMKGKHHTPEARAKISEANRRREYTEEQKEQLREAGKIGRAKMKSKEWQYPKESRKRMAEALSMPVLQMDLEGNIIREFASTIEADLFVNKGKRHNHIADVCNGKRKTAGGYKWMYKKERSDIQ